jgi:hypothetical protein
MKKTVEEAAKEYANGFEYNDIVSNTYYVTAYQSFIAGAKYQSEQMYSEQELEVAFFEGRENNLSFIEWFKQYKNK